jgi:diguanylate cyclase (GGDEF)-like protein/putative nucleotidyltransferase with HDIG domain
MALVFLMFFGVYAFAPDRRLLSLHEESFISLVYVLTCAAMLGGWVHTRDMERRFWSLVLAGSVFLAVGRLYQLSSLAGVGAGWFVPGDVLSGVLEILAVTCLLGLMTTFSRFRHSSLAAQARYVVDVLAVCLIAAGALEIWVIGPWYDSLGSVSTWIRIVYSASPIVGIVALVGIRAGVLGTRSARWESWERLLVFALMALSAGLVLAPIAYADSRWSVMGGWAHGSAELAWLGAGLLAIAASAYRHLECKQPWRVRPIAVLQPTYGIMPSVVLPALQIAALLLYGIAGAEAQDPSARAIRLGIVGWVALTLAIRTLLTVADTQALASGIVTDRLTGLYNHRHMHRALDEELSIAVRYGESVSVLVLDIDDFSRTNAVAGHATGDEVLAQVARAIDRAVRTRDIVSRSGGDEFVVILPSADEAVVGQVARRVLAEIHTVSVPGVGALSASAGTASLPAADGEDLLRRAEVALRAARAAGGGSVVSHDPALDESPDPEDRIRELSERSDTAMVRALASAVDARDEATQDHSRNVARYAAMLAREIGLDERTVLHLEYAGLLHDVGKIGMSDTLLRKPGPLTATERDTMESHVVLAEEILRSTSMHDILPWVRHHHERWDGGGYPDHLAGEQIPLGARIIALANAYDAMRSDRPYRVGLSRSAALQEIDLGLGTAFDPGLGERFIDSIGRTFL